MKLLLCFIRPNQIKRKFLENHSFSLLFSDQPHLSPENFLTLTIISSLAHSRSPALTRLSYPSLLLGQTQLSRARPSRPIPAQPTDTTLRTQPRLPSPGQSLSAHSPAVQATSRPQRHQPRPACTPPAARVHAVAELQHRASSPARPSPLPPENQFACREHNQGKNLKNPRLE